MIRIQHLKEPKITSGTPIAPGKRLKFAGLTVSNHNSYPVYIDRYSRPAKKKASKSKKKVAKKKPAKKSVKAVKRAKGK